MSINVTVVDFGVGNLLNVVRACEFLGTHVTVTEKPEEVAQAERLILPGVGAFARAMQGLSERHLIEPLREFAKSGRPLLGICIGMQVMFNESLEFGSHAGMGLIPGQVTALPREDSNGRQLRVPQIGWAKITALPNRNWQNTPLETIEEGEDVYFVHSFAAQPSDPSHQLATYEFGGHAITAAVQRDNIIGYQFHPEKSAHVGLTILGNFLNS